MGMKRTVRGCVLTVLCTASCVSFAFAATDGAAPPLTITLGAGAARLPDYEGARTQRSEIYPIVNARLTTEYGAFTVGGDTSPPGNNIPLFSWALGDPGHFLAAAFIDYDGGRRDDRGRSAFHAGSRRLRGLGNLSGTLEYGVFGSITSGVFTTNLDARTAPSSQGHGGTIADIAVDIAIRIDAKLELTASPSVSWASQRYLRRYFGVTPAQSAASGFATYTPDAGVKNAGLTISANYQVDKHWLAVANLAASRLLGSAANSPIVERRTSISPSIGVAYRW